MNLNGYNSEEDEDYVPPVAEEEPSEGEDEVVQAGTKKRKSVGGNSGKSKKRQSKVKFTKFPSKRPSYGAAVISDSEEEEDVVVSKSDLKTDKVKEEKKSEEEVKVEVKKVKTEEQDRKEITEKNEEKNEEKKKIEKEKEEEEEEEEEEENFDDIDSLWASMKPKSETSIPEVMEEEEEVQAQEEHDEEEEEEEEEEGSVQVPQEVEEEEDEFDRMLREMKSGNTEEEDQKQKEEMSSGNNMGDTIKVMQRVKFAGQRMEVEKSVKVGSKEAEKLKNSRYGGRAKLSNLSSLLKDYTSGSTITTVEKSRVDWEKDKELEGDAEELKHARKDGYIEKVAFLSKVDVLEFQTEKGIRDNVRKSEALKALRKGK